uniref:Ribosomal protein L5 n=1 Tax=Telonemida sp. TaxID=2652706 RepID=A0A5P8DJZ6_9EUKA|nr:ribosomal protein L5 [Telonemida sp.]
MIKSVKYYKENVLNRDLVLKHRFVNVMQTPRVEKVSLSLNKKEALLNSNKLFVPLLLLKIISGQKPCVVKSKKSVAQFKLREGKALGGRITLRKTNLYTFIDKFIYTILPQLVEDKNKRFKVNHNVITFGIEDISIFPELDSQYELLKVTQGINIAISLTNSQKILSYSFFKGIKFPVQEKKIPKYLSKGE